MAWWDHEELKSPEYRSDRYKLTFPEEYSTQEVKEAALREAEIDKSLGKPVCAFEDTFSAESAVIDHFFPNLRNRCGSYPLRYVSRDFGVSYSTTLNYAEAVREHRAVERTPALIGPLRESADFLSHYAGTAVRWVWNFLPEHRAVSFDRAVRDALRHSGTLDKE